MGMMRERDNGQLMLRYVRAASERTYPDRPATHPLLPREAMQTHDLCPLSCLHQQSTTQNRVYVLSRSAFSRLLRKRQGWQYLPGTQRLQRWVQFHVAIRNVFQLIRPREP